MTTTIPPAVSARARKLHELATKTDNKHESKAAKTALGVLLKKHGVSLKVALRDPDAFAFGPHPLVEGRMDDHAWPVRLANIVASHHGCIVQSKRKTKRSKLVLRVFGSDAARAKATERYAAEYKRMVEAVESGGSMRDWIEGFLLGGAHERLVGKRLAVLASSLPVAKNLGEVEAAYEKAVR